MKNVALVIVPNNITEQHVLNHAPAGAEVSWHGSMPGETVGLIRVPGSIDYRGGFAPLFNTQLLMLQFTKDYTLTQIQNWLDGFSISPAILVAVWYGSWVEKLEGETVVKKLRSWQVRNGLLGLYTAIQIKNQLRNYFPEGKALSRLPHWQGCAYVEFDTDEAWLTDQEVSI